MGNVIRDRQGRGHREGAEGAGRGAEGAPPADPAQGPHHPGELRPPGRHGDPDQGRALRARHRHHRRSHQRPHREGHPRGAGQAPRASCGTSTPRCRRSGSRAASSRPPPTSAGRIGVQWGGNASFSPATGNPTGLFFPNIASGAGGCRRRTAPPAPTPRPNYAVNLPAAIGAGQRRRAGLPFGSAGGAFNLNLRLSALENAGVGEDHLRAQASPPSTTTKRPSGRASRSRSPRCPPPARTRSSSRRSSSSR